MDKAAFKTDTRYTLAWRDGSGRVRPLNIYVLRAFDGFMVGRETSNEGLLRRVGYGEVERIVQTREVAPNARLAVPAALLEETTWRDRTVMQHYGSSPGLGK